MSYHAYACCSELPPCPFCIDSCDFATSYQFTGILLTFLWEKSYGNCPPCPYENGSIPTSFKQQSYGVQVTLTQLVPYVLQRFGTPNVSPCYYRACGFLEMEWQIDEDVRYGCCNPVQGGPLLADCDDSQQITGVENVPFCYTIECVDFPLDGCPNDSKGVPVWRHTLVVCGTRVASSSIDFVPDCGPNPDCGIEPGPALYMTGMTYQWYTPLVALAALGSPDANHLCGPFASTDIGCTCSGVTVDEDNQLCGPFSVYAVGNCQAPWPCVTTNSACQLGAIRFPTQPQCVQDANCQFTPECPCGSVTGTCDCARHDATWSFTYPTYV